jgi:hypothetical protein
MIFHFFLAKIVPIFYYFQGIFTQPGLSKMRLKKSCAEDPEAEKYDLQAIRSKHKIRKDKD